MIGKTILTCKRGRTSPPGLWAILEGRGSDGASKLSNTLGTGFKV